MKNGLLVAALLFSLWAGAQVKEGFVKYKTTMASEGNDMAALLAGNSSMTLYFKNEKSLTEMTTPIFNVRTLTDSKGTLMLMDGASEKIFTRTAPVDPPKSNSSAPTVTITTEKKKIVGFECVKAIVTGKDNKGNSVNTYIWFTDKLFCQAPMGFVNTDVLQKVKGLPLEVTLSQGPVKSTMTAIELSLKPVPDAVFVLSTAGYSEKKAMPRKGN